MDVGGSVDFDVDNSIASLLGVKEQNYSTGIYTANKIVDIMGFNTINIHFNFISGIKDNGSDKMR